MPDLFTRLLEGSLAAVSSVEGLRPVITQASALITAALRDGGKIMTCGNGGSAAESAHLSTELLCRLEKDRRSLAALNLAADASFLTATANDYQFQEVFARQVSGLGKPGDVLVVFTTSGNSPNILRALEAAGEAGVRSIALLGRDGGKAAALADLAIVVPAQATMHIQEAHQVILHILCAQMEEALFPGLNG